MKLRHCLSTLAAACTLAGASMSSQAAVLLSEGFDSLAGLPGAGWVFTNNSQPLGSTDWFQGNTGVFTAAAGADDSYAAANFNNAGTPAGRISNWMITPVMALDTPATLAFALRLLGDGLLDTVEVYVSTSGASADVGTTDTSTGDFSLLQSYASISDTGWVNESIALGGFGAGTTGRLAFRYVVDDTDFDGNYVGIDSVNVTTRDGTVPEPATAALLAVALAGIAGLRRRR